MGKIKSPDKRDSKRGVISPHLKKLGVRKRAKIVKKLRRSNNLLRKSRLSRAKNVSVTLVNNIIEEKFKKMVLKLLGDETIEEIDGFVEEWEYFQDIDLVILGSSQDDYKEYTDQLREEYNTMDLEIYHSMRSKDYPDSTQSVNIPKAVSDTVTSKLSNMTYEDDCVIVDVTPASIICLDDGDSELNLNEPTSNNNKVISSEQGNDKIYNSALDDISSFSDTALNNDADDTQLFVIDSRPGFNGSKVPLYHSIISCAQSTPLRNGGDTEPTNTEARSCDSVNKNIFMTPKLSSQKRCDTDVILIEDENDSVVSLTRHDSTMDESVIFCGVQNVQTPIRRIETTTPSPNKKRILTPVKRNRLGNIINPNRIYGQSSKNSEKTLHKHLQNSFKASSTDDNRIVIIDGCNVAFGHGNNKKFSAEGIEIALRYFERRGHETKIVVPQFRLRVQQSTNQSLMHRLQDSDKLVVTPSKNLPGKMSSSYDDRFILQLAEEFDAVIISNDNYRDLLLENPAWKNIIETRVIGYSWLKDFFMVPTDPYGKSGPKLDDILKKKT